MMGHCVSIGSRAGTVRLAVLAAVFLGGLAAPAVSAAPRLEVPFRVAARDGVHLTTEPGGASALARNPENVPLPGGRGRRAAEHGFYRNPYHAAVYIDEQTDRREKGAFYALDFDGPAGTAVVPAGPGRVTDVQKGGRYPYVVIEHGGGWSTEYGAFEVSPELWEGMDASRELVLGRMAGDGGPNLHFAPRHKGNAHKANHALRNMRLSGVPLTEYRLRRADGTPQPTPIRSILADAMDSTRGGADERAIQLVVKGGGGSTLKGEADGKEKVEYESEYGSVTVALAQVVSYDAGKLKLRNGNVLTGSFVSQSLGLETDLGDFEIALARAAEISSASGEHEEEVAREQAPPPRREEPNREREDEKREPEERERDEREEERTGTVPLREAASVPGDVRQQAVPVYAALQARRTGNVGLFKAAFVEKLRKKHADAQFREWLREWRQKYPNIGMDDIDFGFSGNGGSGTVSASRTILIFKETFYEGRVRREDGAWRVVNP